MPNDFPDTTTLDGFDLAVRDTAYFLWEQAGSPEGRADEFWQQALEQHFRERAYAIWLRQGRPDGRDEQIWQEAHSASQPPEAAPEPEPTGRKKSFGNEPMGDISRTDLDDNEAYSLAADIEGERDA